jgi:putative flippase GtrA
MILIHDKQERTRFLKFMVVGTIGFVVDFAVFNLCRSGFKIIPEVSSVISFIVAVLSNFTFNRYWTYPDSRSKPLMSQLAQFGVVNVIGLVIRTVVFTLINGPLAQLAENVITDFLIPGQVIGENVALAIVVVLVMFWNFFANRYWTYNDVD